jgi:hypothetical protein
MKFETVLLSASAQALIRRYSLSPKRMVTTLGTRLEYRLLRVCEKIATITGLADESVCPTLRHKVYVQVGQALSPANDFFHRP